MAYGGHIHWLYTPKREVSKRAEKLMNLRGISANDIPGSGKINIRDVEEYLRSLEAVDATSVNSKTDLHEEDNFTIGTEEKIFSKEEE